MIVGASRYDPDTAVHQSFAQRLRIVDDVLLVHLELRLQCFLEADCLRRDHMHQRTSLDSREDRLVKVVLVCCFLIAENHSAARSAQSLVRGRCHDIRIRDRAWMKSRRNQTGDVRHVNHEHSTAGVRDLTEFLKVDRARVGTGTGNDHLRLALKGNLHHLVVIDESLVIYTVRYDMKIGSGKIDW